MDAAREIEDPSDWLNTSLAYFLPLDNALRCQVCKDFYDTPMITSCSHTFCSKCIRDCLSIDGKCPTCRATDQASKLRNNLAIEESVEAFKTARPSAYKIALKDKLEQTDATPKRPGKRRRISYHEDAPGEEPRRQTRSMRNNRTSPASSSMQIEGAVEIVDSEGDGDEEFTPDDGLVACPICSTRMKEREVDPHLDGECDGTKKADKGGRGKTSRTPVKANPPQRPPPPQLQPTKAQERLAGLQFNILNDGQIRKKFQALGIPTTGKKELLKDRYTEWVNIWNANCDSSHPKSKAALLNELKKWERIQGGQARDGDSAGIMKKDFDASGWHTNNKDDFARLIEQARKGRKGAAGRIKEQDEDQMTEDDGASAMNVDSPAAPRPQHDTNGPPTPTAQSQPQAHFNPGRETSDHTLDSSRPFDNNPAAMSSIREKVAAANEGRSTEPLMNEGFKSPNAWSGEAPPQSGQPHDRNDYSRPPAVLRQRSSLGDHFSEPARTVPMLRVPESPISDNDEAH